MPRPGGRLGDRHLLRVVGPQVHGLDLRPVQVHGRRPVAGGVGVRSRTRSAGRAASRRWRRRPRCGCRRSRAGASCPTWFGNTIGSSAQAPRVGALDGELDSLVSDVSLAAAAMSSSSPERVGARCRGPASSVGTADQRSPARPWPAPSQRACRPGRTEDRCCLVPSWDPPLALRITWLAVSGEAGGLRMGDLTYFLSGYADPHRSADGATRSGHPRRRCPAARSWVSNPVRADEHALTCADTG